LGSRDTAPRIIDFGTRWRWWSASRPGRFTPREKDLDTPWIGGGWAPEPVWTRWGRENFPARAGTRTPDHLARSSALYRWAIPIP
jgi:hypothetical protein